MEPPSDVLFDPNVHPIYGEGRLRLRFESADANGFKDRTLRTRVGELELRVPQIRGAEFHPRVLERGRGCGGEIFCGGHFVTCG